LVAERRAPFFGRDNLLTTVTTRLGSGEQAAALLIGGEAGIGKSRFAAEAAAAVATPRTLVLHRTFHTGETPFAQARALALALLDELGADPEPALAALLDGAAVGADLPAVRTEAFEASSPSSPTQRRPSRSSSCSTTSTTRPCRRCCSFATSWNVSRRGSGSSPRSGPRPRVQPCSSCSPTR
jgi:hypothetical protein